MLNKYPLWKNLLLIFIVVLGFIYATPNLYGDDPSVQISSRHNAALDQATMQTIEQTLSQQHLTYKSVAFDNSTILVRFFSTDVQLKAMDFIKATLGNDYTVALNLAPSTPKWLLALNALPMKLGLDLRGGVHFLLSVDVNSVIARQLQGDVSGLMSNLRDKQIRYADISLQKNDTISLQFRDATQAKAAMAVVQRRFPDLQLLPKQSTPLNLIVALSPPALKQVQDYTIDQTMTTLRNRINELGVSEAVVQQQGDNRVSVDLPGIQDTARAKEILGGTATVDYRMVDQTDDPRVAQQTGVIPPGAVLYQWHGEPILLQSRVILTGNAITDASTSFDQMGRPSVDIRIGGSAVNLFNRVTSENIGKLMAVVYVETQMQDVMKDGKVVQVPKTVSRVISVATIQSALGTSFQITGLTNRQEAQNLALLLRAGALPAAINYDEERTVGPTLGQENIHKGILSLEVAMMLVILFMAFYYRVFGIVADIALVINLVLLVALLSLLGATLTLPGIAGIVLTVGMAVDANVLIFERIREELRNGVSPQVAINAGYERAFVTIVDANVTTLIVAMVLFGIGTEAVKGFAVTLTLGLLTSMLSGIVISRGLINAIYGGRTIKKLSIGI